MSAANVSTNDPLYATGTNALSLTPRGGLRTNIDPATSLVAVTASNTTVYSPPLRRVYIGTTGNIALLAQNDTVAVTFETVPAGTVLDVCAVKVMSTGTTASNIVGML